MKQFFVTGIGTEVGKTVAAATLVQKLQADYWKPVQAGDLHETDTDRVRQWTQTSGHFHPEAYRLERPMSPHQAAALEGRDIRLDTIEAPETENTLVVEGAGGLLVPLNQQDLMIDLIEQLQIPVVLVSRNYLGSINHTLLSWEALKQRDITVAGILFNGPSNPATEAIILKHTGYRVLGHIPEAPVITPEFIAQCANSLVW